MANNGLKNKGSRLLSLSLEFGKKGLYMVGGPTMPPHLYLSLLLI
jgi:hypothetical protein